MKCEKCGSAIIRVYGKTDKDFVDMCENCDQGKRTLRADHVMAGAMGLQFARDIIQTLDQDEKDKLTKEMINNFKKESFRMGGISNRDLL